MSSRTGMSFFRSPIVSDLIGFALIAGLSLVLGVTVNCFRSAPLSLLSYQEPIDNPADGSSPEITLPNLQKMVGQPGVAIIDARPWDFFALGHIPGAVNLPLSDLQTPTAPLPPSLAKVTLIIVYCSDVSCPAAKTAARLLEKSGYRHVVVFPGGWYAWKKAGLPIGYAS
jgi:rhodanese-related sulfurtransferase